MLLLFACAPGAELTTVDAPGFGHVPIELTTDVPVDRITVGGALAYDLQQDGTQVTAVFQGALAGEHDVLVYSEDLEIFAGPLTVAPTADPLFDRVVGIGASLTQGVQDGVPTFHANLMSPGAQMTRQVGAHYGIPLLVDPLFPTITPDDIGPAPECTSPAVVKHVTDAAIDVLNVLNDEDNNFRYDLGRIDPDLVVHNAAVGGFQVSDLTEPVTDDFTKGFVAHMVLDPYGGLNDSIPITPVELVLEQDPTLVLCFDTYGNDLIGAVVLNGHVDLNMITDEDTWEADILRLLDQLSESDAEVFLANSPRPGLLPAAKDQVARADDPVSEQAKVDEADAITVRYNARLDELAADYPQIHVVDAWQYAEDLGEFGLESDGQQLSTQRYGGLLSLDGVHFTDTGYAAFGNLFFDAIEDELGVSVERLDLDAITAADARSPRALTEAGLDLDACD
ncbi:MAG: SGNH/GDSL hydrolase family protein [Proteobacteria bacterium]|nr:SGNH/GDSL hydrolase family protein [Pseudomonadota bacterium]MCP4921550.1 SGNH/GDSL hydrolase family protein [Pseudomonadota bacterium]